VLDNVLQVALCIASAATAIRLLLSGLFRRYPFFFCYLVLRTPYAIAPLLLHTNTRSYFNLWLWAEPIFCVLYALIVFELYRLVLGDYRGLHTVGRWAMWAIGSVSVLISGLMLLPHLGPDTPVMPRKIFSVLALQRGVDTSLVIFLILMIVFLSRYPIRLSRNVRVYAFVYPVFFLSNVLQALMFTLFDLRFAAPVNSGMTALSVACTIAFLILLNSAAEALPSNATPKTSAEQTTVLLAQLDALNTTLLKVSRR
jgi:hypothetical protein